MEMENKTINKPLTVAREELVTGLTNLINHSNLPPILIEPILASLYAQVQQALAQQYASEKAQYEKALAGTENCKTDKE